MLPTGGLEAIPDALNLTKQDMLLLREEEPRLQTYPPIHQQPTANTVDASHKLNGGPGTDDLSALLSGAVHN